MKKLFILTITMTFAAVLASAATKFNVTLYQPTVVNGTQLKPGDYKVEVQGDKATFKLGKTTVEAPVKVEDSTTKNPSNSVRYTDNKLEEIRVGGTRTRLLFDKAPAEAATDAR